MPEIDRTISNKVLQLGMINDELKSTVALINTKHTERDKIVGEFEVFKTKNEDETKSILKTLRKTRAQNAQEIANYQMDVQKIRIRLRAYDHFSIDKSAQEITRTAIRTGAKVTGPVPLPTKRSVYTVLRSPHVDKKSREQFETRIHKRLLEIYDSTPQTVDALMKLDLPAGVDVEIKT